MVYFAPPPHTIKEYFTQILLGLKKQRRYTHTDKMFNITAAPLKNPRSIFPSLHCNYEYAKYPLPLENARINNVRIKMCNFNLCSLVYVVGRLWSQPDSGYFCRIRIRFWENSVLNLVFTQIRICIRVASYEFG